jgi:hypothetical protein
LARDTLPFPPHPLPAVKDWQQVSG